jgi:hydrogenase maturation protease
MKILLLGIGNLLFGDEGIGIHFINYMGQKYRFDTDHQFDIVDGGTLAQRLIPMMAEYDQIIIVDTVHAPDIRAGEVYFFDFDAVPAGIDWQGSAHEVEMLQTLAMMDLIGDRPKTMILGVVPTVIEATEFSLSENLLHAINVMDEVLVGYLQTLGIQAIQTNEVHIHSVLSESFRSADAYSL